MDEYISKAEAIEAIKQTYCPNCDSCNGIMCKDCGYQDCMDIVDDVKAADVQPAVYCKDCKYAQNPNDTMVYCTYFECGTMSQNDFCSQGERSC